MCTDNSPSGEFLLIVALLASFQIAQGRTADEVGVLAAFFTVLGDNLALIAVRRTVPEAAGGAEGSSEGKSPVKCIDKSNKSV